MDQSQDIHFGGWTLHRKSGELLKDGARIRLQSQPLHILEELLASPGELVTREQLIRRLWPKGVVDFDTALNTAVRRLRTALDDDADTPRYIETVPRRGYRFIGILTDPAPGPLPGTVAAHPAGTPTPLPRPRWRAAAALLLVTGIAAATGYWWPPQGPVDPTTPSIAPAVLSSIAVLPFEDPGAEREQRYLTQGLTDEVTSLLARTPGLRVTARSSSFSVQREVGDGAAVARSLNVTHLLEGNVRRSGDRVQIAARLIEPATNSRLWSQTYDRRHDDIRGLPLAIATSVAEALRLAPPGPASRSVDAQAYDRFLRANYFFHRRAPGDVERARQYLEQAVAMGPDFARAWAALAGVAWIETVLNMVPEEVGLARLRDAAEKALLLDPRLADAHLRLANYRHSIGEPAVAEEHIRAAAALEPGNPLVLGYIASIAAADGRFDEAIELQRQAVAADPLSPLNRYNLGSMLYLAGRLEEAKAELLGSLELNPAGTHYADVLGFVLVLQGRSDEVPALVRDWPDDADRMHCLALAYHGLGQQAEADAALDALIELSGTTDPFRVAEVYAYRGERDRAFEWLQAATDMALEDPWPRTDQRAVWIMKRSPLLKTLHADPRWSAWLSSMQRPGPGPQGGIGSG